MTYDSAPDDDTELDFAQYRRVQEALRNVPPQDPHAAERMRETAMTHWSPQRRRRQPVWLAAAAAGVVALVGVAVLVRSDPSGSDDLVSPAQSEIAAVDATLRVAEAPMADAGATPFDLTSLVDAARALVSTNPSVEPACPVLGNEQSFGVVDANDQQVEVLADSQADTLRLVNASTCEVLALVTLAP